MEVGVPLSKSEITLPRRAGIFLDPARLDHELARRGATQRRLADASGITPVTISRARHGQRINERTLASLIAGLEAIPLLSGAELLISEPHVVNKKAKR
jgi:transcriptional regulator with XRE-family HTH domain